MSNDNLVDPDPSEDVHERHADLTTHVQPITNDLNALPVTPLPLFDHDRTGDLNQDSPFIVDSDALPPIPHASFSNSLSESPSIISDYLNINPLQNTELFKDLFTDTSARTWLQDMNDPQSPFSFESSRTPYGTPGHSIETTARVTPTNQSCQVDDLETLFKDFGPEENDVTQSELAELFNYNPDLSLLPHQHIPSTRPDTLSMHDDDDTSLAGLKCLLHPQPTLLQFAHEEDARLAQRSQTRSLQSLEQNISTSIQQYKELVSSALLGLTRAIYKLKAEQKILKHAIGTTRPTGYTNKYAGTMEIKVSREFPHFTNTEGESPNWPGNGPDEEWPKVSLVMANPRWNPKEMERLETAVLRNNQILAYDPQTNRITQSRDELLKDTDNLDWTQISREVSTRSPEECRIFWLNYQHPDINKNSHLTGETGKKLKRLVKLHGERDWFRVAREIGTGHTAYQLFRDYQRYHNPTMYKKKKWTPEESRLLKETYELFGDDSRAVASLFDGKNADQVDVKWKQSILPFLNNPGMRRGPWTPEEDEQLKEAVRIHGRGNWSKVKQLVPSRTDGQCRERYENVLCGNPNIRRGKFSEDEIREFTRLYIQFGPKWSLIAKEMGTRTDSQVRKLWIKLKCPSPPQLSNANTSSPQEEMIQPQAQEMREESIHEDAEGELQSPCGTTDARRSRGKRRIIDVEMTERTRKRGRRGRPRRQQN